MRTTEFDNPGTTLGYDIAMMDIPLFRSSYAPCEVQMRYERPICTQAERCKDCPYPAHGFVCWRDEEHCLRTEMEKINQRKEKHKHERSIEQPATPGIRSGDDPPADTV